MSNITPNNGTVNNDRATAGLRLALAGLVAPNGDGHTYRVKEYHVDLQAQTCTCPDHQHRSTVCKHQHAAKWHQTLAALRTGCEQNDYDYLTVLNLVPQVELGQPRYARRDGQWYATYYGQVDGHIIDIDTLAPNHGDITANRQSGKRYNPILPKTEHSLAAWVAYRAPELAQHLSRLYQGEDWDTLLCQALEEQGSETPEPETPTPDPQPLSPEPKTIYQIACEELAREPVLSETTPTIIYAKGTATVGLYRYKNTVRLAIKQNGRSSSLYFAGRAQDLDHISSDHQGKWQVINETQYQKQIAAKKGEPAKKRETALPVRAGHVESIEDYL